MKFSRWERQCTRKWMAGGLAKCVNLLPELAITCVSTWKNILMDWNTHAIFVERLWGLQNLLEFTMGVDVLSIKDKNRSITAFFWWLVGIKDTALFQPPHPGPLYVILLKRSIIYTIKNPIFLQIFTWLITSVTQDLFYSIHATWHNMAVDHRSFSRIPSISCRPYVANGISAYGTVSWP